DFFVQAILGSATQSCIQPDVVGDFYKILPEQNTQQSHGQRVGSLDAVYDSKLDLVTGRPIEALRDRVDNFGCQNGIPEKRNDVIFGNEGIGKAQQQVASIPARNNAVELFSRTGER